MAVEIEFANVIIRKAALMAKYPGGLDAFAASDLPNYNEDLHLVRIGFMSTGEALDLADDLRERGLIFDDTKDSEVAIVQHESCPAWLATGQVGNSSGCWLAGTDPGPLVQCKGGFMLRCPRHVFQRLETIVARNNIKLSRSEPPEEHRNTFLEVVHFSRSNAHVAANIVGQASGDTPVGIWTTRDWKRRQQCAADIQLVEEIERLLLESGVQSG
jgi:hypothetical protein